MYIRINGYTNKEKNTMELKESVAIKKWGNSQGVILSKYVLELAGLKRDDSLHVEVNQGEIILKKEFKHRSFEDRLAEYGGVIKTCDFDWGEPVGKEVL